MKNFLIISIIFATCILIGGVTFLVVLENNKTNTSIATTNQTIQKNTNSSNTNSTTNNIVPCADRIIQTTPDDTRTNCTSDRYCKVGTTGCSSCGTRRQICVPVETNPKSEMSCLAAQGTWKTIGSNPNQVCVLQR